jgi:3-oxoacyl-[acyl-carrier-protein] synthase-3
MRETLSGCTLRAVTSVLPSTRRAITDFIPTLGQDYVERFQSLVGINTLHLAAPHQKASDFALAAAKRLLQQNPEISPHSIHALLFLTQTPDNLAPITASRLQQALGLNETTLALDLNQGCTGFLAGLLLAANLLQNPAFENVLILGGDTLSHHIDPNEPNAALLFSDGGFAALIGRGEETWTFETLNVPSNAISLPHHGYLQLIGSEVFNFTLLRVTEQLQSLPPAERILLGQSNAFALKQIARSLGYDETHVPIRIAQRGNTSGASLPTLLCDLAAEGSLSQKQTLILSSFGVGLSAISAHLPLQASAIVPLAMLTPKGDLL